MSPNLVEDKVYYFVNKEIVIVNYGNLLDLAIVRYVDSFKEFVVDINFIQAQPSNEKFISIKDLVGRINYDS